MSVIPYTTGNIPTYRFYINTFSSTTYEVFPLNFLETSIIVEQEQGRFFYRRKFSGELIFGSNSKVFDVSGVEQNRSDDFALLWAFENTNPCTKLYFTITKTLSGVTETYWEGFFSTSEGKFDLDNCTFTVTPQTEDDYIEWIRNGDKEFNIFDMGLANVDVFFLDAATMTYSRGWLLMDILEYIVDQIVTGAGVSSDFLTNATNPVTLVENRVNNLTLHLKVDIKYPTETQPTIANITFNQIMEIYRCLNMAWDYDGANIILEHISNALFNPVAGGIDLRTQQMAVASNKYEYIKESLPKYEKFAWMEADEDFVGVDIEYDSECVNQDPYSNFTTLSVNVTTDVEYIWQCVADAELEDLVSDDGFVLLANWKSGANYYCWPYQVPVTGEIKWNGDLSWYSVHPVYWKYRRSLITGYLNGSLQTFVSAKKNKKQDCSIILCEDIDPTEEMTTELGETYLGGVKAMVKKAEIQPTGFTKLNLNYGPEDNINTGSSIPIVVLISEDGNDVAQTSRFVVTASYIDLGGNNTISIQIETDVGGWSGWNNVTIVAGTMTNTVVINWPNVGDTCVNDVQVDLLVSIYTDSRVVRDLTTSC